MNAGGRIVIALLVLAGVPDTLLADTPAATPIIICFGDSITAGPYPSFLAGRLAARRRTKVEVVNEGIGGNRILHDSPPQFGPAYGPAGVTRFQAAISAHPGARVVVVLEGINDILHPGWVTPMSDSVTAPELISGLQLYIRYAHAAGLKILGGTILPFAGCCLKNGTVSPPDWSARESKRQAVNRWIRQGGAFDGVIDFDRLMRDPLRPRRIRPAYDSGDHLHPNTAGYRAMADGIDLGLLQ
jgi:lysophospholipase L1-like esterase